MGLIYTVRQRTRYVQIIRLRTVLKIFVPNDLRDVFEIMQKMNKYNAKIDVIQSDNVYNKGKSITEKSEILHLKEIVKGKCKNKYYTPGTTHHTTPLLPYLNKNLELEISENTIHSDSGRPSLLVLISCYNESLNLTITT